MRTLPSVPSKSVYTYSVSAVLQSVISDRRTPIVGAVNTVCMTTDQGVSIQNVIAGLSITQTTCVSVPVMGYLLTTGGKASDSKYTTAIHM